MKKNFKRTMLFMAALAGVLCMKVPNVQAAEEYALEKYELAENTGNLGQWITLTGGKVEEISLEVKETGWLHANFKKGGFRTESTKVTIQVLDSKKTCVYEGQVTKTKGVYIKKKLSKGTYTLKMSSNLKKDASTALEFAMAFDDKFDCAADGKAVYNVVNANNNSYYKFYNEKDQVVSILADAKGCEDDPVYSRTMTITDEKGNVIVKNKNDIDDSDPDVTEYYLKKGTYTIKCKYIGEDGNYIKISKSASASSNLKVNATSKKKAVKYEGQKLSMAYTSSNGQKKTQWVKMDTSKKSYKFHIEAGTTEKSSLGLEKGKVTLYNSKGKKLESANLEYGEVATASGARDYYYFNLAKNTGVYYLAIETKPNYVVNVKKDSITAKLSYNGKTSYLVKQYGRYTVKSSSKKNVTATVKVYQTAYMKFAMENVSGLSVYNSKGKKVSTYNGSCYKLSSGTYTVKGKAKKAKKNYVLETRMLNASAMKQVVEVKNKKAEFSFTVKSVGKYKGGTLDLRAYGGFCGTVKRVKIYGPDNKLITSKASDYVNFKASKTGKYRVVVTTTENGAFSYEYKTY